MNFFKSYKDLASVSALDSRFRVISAGTLIAVTRVSKTEHFVAFTQDGHDYVFKKVPLQPALLLLNRIHEIKDAVPSNRLAKLIEGVKEFNPSKPAKFVKYTKQGTFPDIRGVVKLEDGSTRDCIVHGAPEPKEKGMVYLMLDQSIVFVSHA